MQKINLTVEQAEGLQNYVSNHIDRCFEVLDWDFSDELPEEYQDVEMFCGCSVCNIREHLLSTFAYLRDAGIVDIAVE